MNKCGVCERTFKTDYGRRAHLKTKHKVHLHLKRKHNGRGKDGRR